MPRLHSRTRAESRARPRSPRRPDVYLGTAKVVRDLLRSVDHPVSRNWLLERLAEEGHSTTRPRLNVVLEFFMELGVVVEGSKGIQWTHNHSASLRRAVATGRRL
jgi:hypothetical protein